MQELKKVVIETSKCEYSRVFSLEQATDVINEYVGQLRDAQGVLRYRGTSGVTYIPAREVRTVRAEPPGPQD